MGDGHIKQCDNVCRVDHMTSSDSDCFPGMPGETGTQRISRWIYTDKKPVEAGLLLGTVAGGSKR